MNKIEKYIIAIITLIAVGAIGTAIYFGVNRDNNTNNSVNEIEKENEKNNNLDQELEINSEQDEVDEKSLSKNEVSMSDKTILFYEAMSDSFNLLYVYIENGEVFYYEDSAVPNDIGFMSDLTKKADMIKLNNVSDAKRLEYYNSGSGVNPTVLIITDNGIVYEFYKTDYGKVEYRFVVYEALKDYKVEDIISYENNKFTLLLKDGTTKVVSDGNYFG